MTLDASLNITPEQLAFEHELDHCFLRDQDINAIRQAGYWDFNWTHAQQPRKQEFAYGQAEEQRLLGGKLRLVTRADVARRNEMTGEVVERVQVSGEMVQPAALAEVSLEHLEAEAEALSADVDKNRGNRGGQGEAGRLGFELQGEMLAEMKEELQAEIQEAMLGEMMEEAARGDIVDH